MAARLVVAFLAVSSGFLAVSGQKFNAIFSFGDSMSDTGNLCVNGPPAGLTLTQPPYGETFFGRATCRCSDGRLVVDFLGTASSAFNLDMSTFFKTIVSLQKTEHIVLCSFSVNGDVAC
jgi:hypothetical protein